MTRELDDLVSLSSPFTGGWPDFYDRLVYERFHMSNILQHKIDENSAVGLSECQKCLLSKIAFSLPCIVAFLPLHLYVSACLQQKATNTEQRNRLHYYDFYYY